MLVIVGDGAFQMTGMELSTIARHGLNPIVVVLNNHGYTTERFLLDGPFNDIQDWAYHKIPEVVGAGLGLEVRTVGELDGALEAALENVESFSLLNVHLDPYDRSPALERLAQRLSKIVTASDQGGSTDRRARGWRRPDGIVGTPLRRSGCHRSVPGLLVGMTPFKMPIFGPLWVQL